MNAVADWKRLTTQLAEDVCYGAPLELITLEANEVPTFLEEEFPHSDIFSMLIDSVYHKEADAKRRARILKLLAECMGDISADRLCELRDLFRSSLIDYCSRLARQKVEEVL